MAKAKKSRSKRRSGGGRSKGIDPKWLIAGAAVLVAGAVYFATSGSASAATRTLPVGQPTPTQGRAPTPPRPRTAATSSLPAMNAQLYAMLNESSAARRAWWVLAALYTLNHSNPAPTVATVNTAMTGFTPAQLSALRAQDITDLTYAGNYAMDRLLEKLNGRAIRLPYQVPQNIWDDLNLYVRNNTEWFQTHSSTSPASIEVLSTPKEPSPTGSSPVTVPKDLPTSSLPDRTTDFTK